MKSQVIQGLGCFLVLVAMTGCSATSAEYGSKGAAIGAVSGSFVGAMTDLIIDGKVDTDRLARNAVAGAVAGGTAGAVAGYQKDKASEKAAESGDAKAEPQAVASTSDVKGEDLKQRIGAQNVSGLEMLVACRHADAYRTGQQTARADNTSYRDAGLILQALVDHDRGNSDGVARILPVIVEKIEKVTDQTSAEKGLSELQQMLDDERSAQGLNPSCN